MQNKDFLVISTSLNPDSKSRMLAKHAHATLDAQVGCEFVDLRDFALPMCDGNAAYAHPDVALVTKKIINASCIIVATPIYNYDVNAAFKNLIELSGRAWHDKVVGFLCAAGGKSSYMSVMAVANSLMLDFRSVIIPRFVYAEGSQFSETVIDETVQERINELTKTAIRLTGLVHVAP
jgi:NAD(P)H-dependent FMN reductase